MPLTDPPSVPAADDVELARMLKERAARLRKEIGKRIVGQDRVVELLLIALFSRGHGLFVGVPGLAKTLLIQTLADALGLTFNRIQFTPDLMPSDITIEPGEFFVLLGPSGSGKTTTLRILAGLETVSGGRVLMDGNDVTHLEPGARDVAMVFQSYALYPHMTVAQNIGFPLKMIGTPQAEIERQVAEAAARVDISHLLARKPGQLSGGQQQRCALARAIVRKPRLFLLDEPLSNLDAKLRLETRLELHALQRGLGTTTVYVTHDQEEAMTLADRIAVFMEGRIAQVGTPRDVFSTPMTMAVAGFVGTPQMNFMPGTWQGASVTVDGHALAVARPAPVSRTVMLGVRPNDLMLAPTGLPARIERVEDLGDSAIVSVTSGGKRFKLKGPVQPDAKSGNDLFLTFAPQAAHLFDPQSGERL